ncbi:MAG: UTRA domain-containing protein [Thermoleophilia bacterium]
MAHAQLTPDAPVPTAIAQVLRVGPRTPSMRVDMVLAAGGSPRALVTEHLHPDARPGPELVERLRQGSSTVDILMDGGVPVAYCQCTIRPRLLTPGERAADVLGLTQSTAAIEVVETAHLATGSAVWHGVSVMLPDTMDLRLVRHLDSDRAAQPRPLEQPV